MILPVIAYGDPILKRKAKEIPSDYPELQTLIDNMFETMYSASGVGLAAPQVGESIRLFIVDASPFAEDEEDEMAKGLEDFKEVFINPEVYEKTGEMWAFEEGCLSIPTIREEVMRESTIRIKYLDRDFKEHDEELDGYAARVVLHEFDHIEGILFTDKLSPLRRRMLKRKLADITKGNVDVKYRMRFPNQKKRL